MCFATARSACLHLRPVLTYVRLRWLVKCFDVFSEFWKHNLEFQVWFTHFSLLSHRSVKNPPPVVTALVVAIKLRGRRATDTRRLTQNSLSTKPFVCKLPYVIQQPQPCTEGGEYPSLYGFPGVC